MYKLAVFDLDGTLLNSKHEVSEENLEAINLLHQNNIKVVIATGRSSQLLKPYIKKLNITSEIITCNGTVIGNPSEGSILYEDIVSKEQVRKTLEMCIEYNHEFLVYTSKAVVARQEDWNKFLEEKNVSLDNNYKANFIPIKDINEVVNNHNVNKILIIERDNDKYNLLNERVKDYNTVSHTQSAKSYVDIGPLNNSKGNAVKILCEKFGFKLEEVIAFGDQMNDISMISIVGLGVAMGNAKDEVKESANYITLTNDQNGVAYAIKNKILK